MQGKERNNQEIDDEFVSHAWDSMKHLLDQEMPVTPTPVAPVAVQSDRRLPLLLLMLLFSFGAGAAWMYWYHHSTKPKPPEEAEPRAMLFEATEKDPSTIAEIKTSEFETKSTLTPSTSTIEIKPQAATDIETATQIQNELPKTTAEQESPAAAQTINPDNVDKANIADVQFGWVDPANIPSTIISVVSPDAPENTTTESKAKSRVKKAPATDNKVIVQALSPNAATPLASPTNPLGNSALETLATIKHSKKLHAANPEITPSFFQPIDKKWRIALEAAAIRDGGTREFSNSFSIGAIIEKQLDNRFSLQSGVSWHHLVKRPKDAGSTRNKINTLGDTLKENFVLEDYYANAIETGVLEVLDYVKVPLQMSYKINRKIRIHTGVHVAYLLSPIQRRSNENVTLYDDEGKPTKALLEEVRRVFVRSGLKKLDFGVQVGLGIYPTERMGLFVNYNSGLLDFSKNEHFLFKEVHSNQYLQLGLVYYPFKR